MARSSGRGFRNEETHKTPWTKVAVDWARTHLILTVLIGLFASWILVSWMVYRAEYLEQGANITSFGKALWWGVVTFLTVGYGDFSPVTVTGRVWAGLLMFTGVFGVAIITSKISSYFLEQALREGKGIVNTSKLKNHFVVCGWKEDMHELLTHILDFNPDLLAEELIMVAPVSPSVVEEIHEFPRLKNIQVIIGDYSQAVILKKAAPERARKVLILADRSPHANGTVPNMTETDARSIMTAMTLSSIARGTLVAAEILDPKMDQYLKLASVSEIIYSREYSRLLLGNASGGTGVSNIIFDLLDPKTPTLITTHAVPEAMLGKSYPELKLQFEGLYPKSVVIGILENTGNSHRIKELALRQAQKTPDVSRLVQNLRGVKELKCNHPVFSPGPDYVIHEGSMVIVIETRMENMAKGEEDADPKEAPRAA